MIRAAVIGATGYSGLELIRILLNHPYVEVTYLGGRRKGRVLISDIHPSLYRICDMPLLPIEAKKIAKAADVAFICLPHTMSMHHAGQLLAAGLKVIDLSADYRLKDARTYEKWYKAKHTDKANIKKAAYGLPELFFEKIRTASLVANPGCYPTGAILAAAPILTGKTVNKTNIIIDAKSGVTGAGKKPSEATHFPECNEDVSAYKILAHQHTPEIDQILSKLSGSKIEVTFTPHLVPIDRGILSTCYFELKSRVGQTQLRHCYQTAYCGAPFVRIMKEGMSVKVKNVSFTNYCDIGVYTKDKMVVVVSAIDNLVKGASGQAVQNMNIMFGIEETSGLSGTLKGHGND